MTAILMPGELTTLPTWFVANAAMMLLALGLDSWLGEPRRFHPLVGFGNWATWLEPRCRAIKWLPPTGQGLLAWGGAVLPWLALVILALHFARAYWPVWAWLSSLLLYFTIGGKSLRQHGARVYQPLQHGDIDQARAAVAMMVSRNSQTMDKQAITSATIESVLENGNDAVFGPLFWFALLGAPGALLFRLANTLDAMWGYKTQRYLEFGRCSAKFDDALGWLPARICALGYASFGDWRQAWYCRQTQAKDCASPNGGVVMTAGAGALGVTIGGPAYYHGVLKDKPLMGCKQPAQYEAIARANRLVLISSWGLCCLWFGLCLMGYVWGVSEWR